MHFDIVVAARWSFCGAEHLTTAKMIDWFLYGFEIAKILCKDPSLLMLAAVSAIAWVSLRYIEQGADSAANKTAAKDLTERVMEITEALDDLGARDKFLHRALLKLRAAEKTVEV